MSNKVYKSLISGLYHIYCPACRCYHAFGEVHGFNGNYNNPTVVGSLGWTGEVNIIGEVGNRYCHSQITNGKIRYYEDSWHNLKGKELELPNIINDES